MGIKRRFNAFYTVLAAGAVNLVQTLINERMQVKEKIGRFFMSKNIELDKFYTHKLTRLW